MSEICQIQQVLQLKYAKLEEAVEKLSTVNMSLQEANSQLNCLLQVRVCKLNYIKLMYYTYLVRNIIQVLCTLINSDIAA